MHSQPWTFENEKRLTAPYDYLVGNPGKDLRMRHVEAFDAILQVPPAKAKGVAMCIQSLHTASLLIDDVEDNSLLRRGRPVAHAVFGIPQTINTSCYVMFFVLQSIMGLFGTDAANIYVEEMMALHRGQGLDLYWRDTFTCPTEEEYIGMVLNKTSGLHRLAVRLMQNQSTVPVDLVPLANTLGVLYQIQDDYLNLQSEKYTNNKGFCEDITEGKFSFPIIHSIRADPANQELMGILRQRTTERRIKEYALQIMERTGSFAYTLKTITSYKEKARAEIDELPSHLNKEPLYGLLMQILLI